MYSGVIRFALFADAAGLRDTISVLHHQQKYLVLLQRYIKHVFSGDMKRFGRLLLNLSGLRTKAVHLAEVFQSFIVADHQSVMDLIENGLLATDDPQLLTSVDQVVITSAPELEEAEQAIDQQISEPLE